MRRLDPGFRQLPILRSVAENQLAIPIQRNRQIQEASCVILRLADVGLKQGLVGSRKFGCSGLFKNERVPPRLRHSMRIAQGGARTRRSQVMRSPARGTLGKTRNKSLPRCRRPERSATRGATKTNAFFFALRYAPRWRGTQQLGVVAEVRAGLRQNGIQIFVIPDPGFPNIGSTPRLSLCRAYGTSFVASQLRGFVARVTEDVCSDLSDTSDLLGEMRVAEIYASWTEAVPAGKLGSRYCVICGKMITQFRSLSEIDV
jgi:hypothetical protein